MAERRGRPPQITVPLFGRERRELAHLVRQGHRAAMVLALDAGLSVQEVATLLATSRRNIYKWVARFQALGIEGLRDAPRPGRPTPM